MISKDDRENLDYLRDRLDLAVKQIGWVQNLPESADDPASLPQDISIDREALKRLIVAVDVFLLSKNI